MKNSQSNAKITAQKMGQLDTQSQMSKRSLTRSELSKFFAQGKKKANEAASERLSQMSKGSKFKNQLASKIAKEKQETQQVAQPPEDKAEEVMDVPVEAPEEMPYVDQPDEVEEPVDRDQVSVATEVIDGLSVAPTEMLANEYKRLVEQYEEEQRKRKELE